MEILAVCPNTNHEDWKYSVDKLGEDKTWYIYDKLGQQIPTQQQVDSILIRLSKEIRPNSPAEVVLKLKDAKTFKDVEDAILGYKGIINSKRYQGQIWVKVQNEISRLDHMELAKQLEREVNSIYPGLITVEYQTKRSLEVGHNVVIVNISEYAWNKYLNRFNDENYQQGLLFKRNIGNILVDIKARDREDISNIFDQSKDITNVYDYINNLVELIPDLSQDHKDLIKEFSNLRTLYPDLQVVQINRKDLHKYFTKEELAVDENKFKDALGIYYNNIIYLIKNNLVTESKNMLVGTILHEIIHAPTKDLIDRYDEEGWKGEYTTQERKFIEEISDLFKSAKGKTKYSKRNAYKNLKEFVADGITDQTIIDELKTMYDKEKLSLWEKIKRSIRKLFGWEESSKSYHAQLLTSIMDYVYKAKHVNTGVENIQAAKIRDNISIKEDNPTHRIIVDALAAMEDAYDNLGIRYETVGSVMDRLKLGGLPYTLHDPEFQKEYDKYMGIDLITKHRIDKSLKHTVDDIKATYGVSNQAAEDLERYLKRFINLEGATIISNLTLVDLEHKLANKADIVVIDKNNEVYLFKIKTKQSDYSNYDRDPRVKKGEPPIVPISEYKRDQIELTILKEIFQTIVPTVKVKSLHVIPLVAVVNKETSVIEKYNVDMSFNGKNVIDVGNSSLIEAGMGMVYIKESQTMEPEDNQDVFTDSETAEMIKESARKYKVMYDKLSTQKSPDQEELEKLIKALAHRADVTAKSGGPISIKLQARFISKLIDEKDTQVALGYAIDEAHKITMDAWETLQKLKESGDTISINQLYKFRDAVSAFDTLENYEALLTGRYGLSGVESKESLDALKLKDPKAYELAILRSKLENAIKWKNSVKLDYETIGLKILSDIIFPYWTKTKSEYKKIYSKEYRDLKYDKEKGITRKSNDGLYTNWEKRVEAFNLDVTEKEFIEVKLNYEGKNIDDASKEAIRKELKKAGQDIKTLTRWIDNVLDSPDSVVASLVKAFVTYDDTARIEIENERLKALPMAILWGDFTKQFGHNYLKVYDFMIERDLKTKKPTGYIVSKISSELMHEYQSLNQILDGTLGEDQDDFKRQVMNIWKETNVPLDKVAYANAYLNYLDELLAKKKITSQEYERLKYEQVKSGVRKRVEEIRQEENTPITDNTVDLCVTWFRKNIWKYREPVAGRANPQWEKLKKILENPDDPRTKMYNMIVDMADRADTLVPTGIKLGTRLPGIIKDKTERLASGQSLAEFVKGGLSDTLTFKVDDTSRVETDLVDSKGNARYFVPTHFTGRVTKKVVENGVEYEVFDPDEQSFNLLDMYYHYLSSAIEFNWKNNILPEMELARYILDNRDVVKRKNNVIQYVQSRYLGAQTEQTIKGGNIAEQFDTWLLYALYGQSEKNLGTIPGTNIDAGKLTGAIQRFTAMNLLGLNYVAGVANIGLGELLQTIEAFAGQHWGKREYAKAIAYYTKNLPGIMGDIGSRKPTNIVSLLLREFNVLHDPKIKNLTHSRIRDLFAEEAWFYTNHIGEHSMQTKGLLASLERRRAYNTKGEDIGSILSLYRVKDDKLEVDKSTGFDEEKSNWANTGRRLFEHEVRGYLTTIHGGYSDLERVAIQQNALMGMAYMFRKFIVPGFRRRWGALHYSERTEEWEEGAYVSTIKFAGRLLKNLREIKAMMLSREWQTMDDYEKANVIRTLGEIITLITVIILANVAIKMAGDDDDDHDKAWNFMAYQALRLKSEFLFFVSPMAAMQILRSPAASISVVENTFKLLSQVVGPGWEEYQQGPWKDHLKIEKTLIDLSIGVRQVYRLRNIEEQVTMMKSKIIRSQ